MACPQSTEYNEAIQNLRSCVSDEELRQGQLALNALGLPMAWSGNFADVYRVHCPASGNTWAVKCFTRESPGLRERYRQISDHLQRARLSFMVDFRYVEPGIRVGRSWHPFLKMRWVEGVALHEFVEKYLDRPATLRQLLELWVTLAARLRHARIAHADLQHGNVLLVPRSRGQFALKLIDYDGMYVPALAGVRSGELGHPAYQHPQRLREGIYGPEVDRFSHLAIFCVVRCLMVGQRGLWRFHTGENLLFRERDFASPENSEVFRELWGLPDAEARALVGRLFLATQGPLAETPLLGEVLSNGSVVPLSRQEEGKVESALGGRVSVAQPAEVSPPKRVASEANRPWWADGTATLPDAPAAGTVGTVPDATRGTRPAPPETRRHFAVKALVIGATLVLGLLVLWRLFWPPAPSPDDAVSPASTLQQRCAEESGIPVEEENSVGMKLVLIPAGGFPMGSPNSDEDAADDEKPQHEVQIAEPFYLGMTEVTQEQWKAVMGNNPSMVIWDPDRPVECVSWDDAREFCRLLSEKEGEEYRLPTEAEWEYACRAGSTTKWSFGNEEADLKDYARCRENSKERTDSVGNGREPNAWGLLDMHGNVCEWCADWYAPDYYEASPSADPKGPDSGSCRILRGGSWKGEAKHTRAACRQKSEPNDRNGYTGFRVARTP